MSHRHAAPSSYLTSHSSMAPPSNTTLHTSASVPESRELKEFLRFNVKHLRIPEEEFRKKCKDLYGSVEKAMEAVQEDAAWYAAAIAEAFPPGERPKAVGRKPIPGEDRDVQIAPLSDGVWVRIWGGDVASQGCYCFDFVNSEGQHRRTPSNIKVFSEATAWMPSTQVRSIEASLDKAMQQSPEFADTLRNSCDESHKPDPNWETYIVQQGIRLCFKQAGKEDVFVDIAGLTPAGATLTFQPWRQCSPSYVTVNSPYLPLAIGADPFDL
ncbi:hypothetical protein B0H34DRAFT_858719 [Crassisporium funariophilum]|nr:hypothetical protein B0H34DRAFT_858719 [Crassisporium funariophilum]